MIRDMLQEKSHSPLRTFFIVPSQFQGLGLIGVLCFLNLGLILLLGSIMMLLSGRFEFFMMTLTMMGSAGSMVVLLLINLQKLKFKAYRQHIESKAYEAVQAPLLILAPGFQLCYRNKSARQYCWWAESVAFLKKCLVNAESRAALERLIHYFDQQKIGAETLVFQGVNGKEIWHIQTTPLLENKALWQCTNITQEKDKNSKYITQLKNLNLFLDNSTEGMFSLNQNGIILFCNDKFAHWLGYSREQLEGTSLAKLVVRPRGQNQIKLTEIQGKTDFISTSSRIKSAFLEQNLIPGHDGVITRSVVNIHAPFASHSDLRRILEMAPLPIIFLDEEGKIQDSNLLFRERFGGGRNAYSRDSFLRSCFRYEKRRSQKCISLLSGGRH